MYGKRIRELRTEKGMSQQELADIVHTNQRTISRYENEELDLSTDMIKKLCDVFDVSADILLGFQDY